MLKSIRAWINDLSPLTAADLLLFGLLTVFCFFSFQHPDLLHTGGSSFTLLNGHFLDFYDENARVLSASNYLISTYIVFALWNLPLKLLNIVKEASMDVGFVVFWYKALTTLFFAGAAVVMYNIGRVIGLSPKHSKLLTAFWLTSPLLFFSQFMFGQYDIITAFFTLLGVLYYLKKDIKLFILFFAVAMTFKYFPVFLFIPLLLLAEKKISKIAGSLALFVLPLLAVMLPFMGSPQFKSGVLGFDAVPAVFNAGFNIGNGISISLFLFMWFFICAAAYLQEPKNSAEFFQWALYLCMSASSLIFALIFWHPQWLLFATPFLAITTYMDKKARFFVLMDLVMFFAFITYSVHHWGGGVDQSLLSLGVFKGLKSGLSDPLATVFMKKILFFEKRTISFTLISVIFFLNIALKYPGTKFDGWQENFSLKYISSCWKEVRLRFFAGILFFIAVAFLTLVIPSGRNLIYDSHGGRGGISTAAAQVVKGTSIGEVFEAGCGELRAVVIKTSDNETAASSSTLIFRISEYTGGNKPGRVIFEKTVTGGELRDKTCVIKMKKVMVSPRQKYIFTLESPDASAAGCVTVWRAAGRTNGDKTFAVINNAPQPFDLDFRIYGR